MNDRPLTSTIGSTRQMTFFDCIGTLSMLAVLTLSSSPLAAAPPTQPIGSFGDVKLVPGLDSPWRDFSPHVSSDGLTIHFASDGPYIGPRDWDKLDIWTATRPSADKPFGEPTKVPSPISSDGIPDIGPFLSTDGLTMYFASEREGDKTTTWVTSRENESASWSEPEPIEGELWSERSIAFDVSDPALSSDELKLYFYSDRDGTRDLFWAERESVDHPFGTPRALDAVNTPIDGESAPSLSADELTLFYMMTPNDQPYYPRIRVATRTSLDQPFADPADLNEFSLGSTINIGGAAAGTPHISPDWPKDGSKLYFFFASGADWDIYEATWMAALLPGDADRDFDFDQHDLVRVLTAGKYLTGQSATWGEGDWNGAPSGSAQNPPVGDGLFNQGDIIAAQVAQAYLAGPYAAMRPNGQQSDNHISEFANDLNVFELLAGDYSDVDLIFVPEPSSLFLGLLGLAFVVALRPVRIPVAHG